MNFNGGLSGGRRRKTGFFDERETEIVENSAGPQGAEEGLGFGGEVDLAVAHGMAVVAAGQIALLFQFADVPLDLPGLEVQHPRQEPVPLEAVALAVEAPAEVPQQEHVGEVACRPPAGW